VGASDTGQKGLPKSACPRCAVSRAFLWVAGQMSVIVGWSNMASGQHHAFVWYSGRIVDLNRLVNIGPGIWLAEATADNDAGQIVANGSNGHAYLIVLPPQLR